VAVLAFQARNRTWPRSLALGLIVGGALGNLLDRVRWGSVIDFVDFGYRRNMFPVFNAADSAITIGVILFAWSLLFSREAASHAAAATAAEHALEPPASASRPDGGAGSAA
jgi:lipoprotein signal peptidase